MATALFRWRTDSFGSLVGNLELGEKNHVTQMICWMDFCVVVVLATEQEFLLLFLLLLFFF